MAVPARGIADIKEFLRPHWPGRGFRSCQRSAGFEKLARDIRRKLPIDPMVRLKQQLEKAVRLEHYEESARFRDQIRQLSSDSPRARHRVRRGKPRGLILGFVR